MGGFLQQACFWFNNGCDISCEECDGQTGQVVHPRFIYNGTGEIPSWGGNGILPDPKQKSAVPKGSRPDGSTRLSICANPKRNATICDKSLRTMNVDADCGSPEDVTYYAPWRYPGAAPVIDSCEYQNSSVTCHTALSFAATAAAAALQAALQAASTSGSTQPKLEATTTRQLTPYAVIWAVSSQRPLLAPSGPRERRSKWHGPTR